MRSRTKAIVWVVVVFLVGAISGGVFRHYVWPTEPVRAGGPRHDPKAFAQHMSEKLNLDEQQRVQLRAILEESREQFRSLEESFREANREQFREIRNATHQRILQILTSDQAARFEELTAKHEKRKRDRPPRPN
jgi:uncharacterized membrane protein